MATHNLTIKYADKIAERFHAKSRTKGRFSNKYKLIGT